MYYYSKSSRNKILHTKGCVHVRKISADNLVEVTNLKEVYPRGYRFCKCCSPLAKQYRKESDAMVSFSCGHAVSFFLENRFIKICTPYSQWKIVPAVEGGGFQLYHRNSFATKHDNQSIVRKYHLQNVRKKTLQEYLEYVVEHEYYRMMHPVEVRAPKKEPPRKGTRRYKNQQKRKEQYEKRKAVRHVLQLIESLNTQPQTGLCSA